jgi:hypothetical protein
MMVQTTQFDARRCLFEVFDMQVYKGTRIPNPPNCFSMERDRQIIAEITPPKVGLRN